MRLVLVGDDGSEAAAHAVEWATRFVAEHGARLTVVHVVATGDKAPADDRAEHVTVRDHHPASAIMEAAADLDADLIVLGRRGSGGFPSLPIGTTVHSVAGAGGRPIVVVPAVDLPADQTLVRRLVIGLDGRPGSADAASWAARNFGGAQFTAVHALDLAPVFAQAEDDNGAFLYERAQQRAVALMRESWSRPLVDAGVTFDAVVERGGAADVLLAVATSAAADLVVVGRRARGTMSSTLGGVTQRILAYSPGAAAIIPSSPDR